MTPAREEILSKLRKATHSEPEKPDFDTPVYFPIDGPLELAFRENLEKVSGNVYICESETDLASRLKNLLAGYSKETIICNDSELQTLLLKHKVPCSSKQPLPVDMEIGITSCEFLVAHTGSVVVSSALEGGRQSFVFPPVHVVIARKNQLVAWLDEAYSAIQKKYPEQLPSQIAVITGPSRTADIEKTLVMGAHGPKALHVFLL